MNSVLIKNLWRSAPRTFAALLEIDARGDASDLTAYDDISSHLTDCLSPNRPIARRLDRSSAHVWRLSRSLVTFIQRLGMRGYFVEGMVQLRGDVQVPSARRELVGPITLRRQSTRHRGAPRNVFCSQSFALYRQRFPSLCTLPPGPDSTLRRMSNDECTKAEASFFFWRVRLWTGPREVEPGTRSCDGCWGAPVNFGCSRFGC